MSESNHNFATARAIALNHQNISIYEKVCFAASDYLYAEKNTEFAQQNGGLENLKKDFVAFVEQFTSQEPCRFAQFSFAIAQLIAANRAFIEENTYIKQAYSPEEVLNLFSTITINVARQSGKTTYIAHHAIDNTCGIVSNQKQKRYMLGFNPHANIFTVDEFMECENAHASTAFIDEPSLVFAIKNKEDIVKKSCQLKIDTLILLGY